MPGLPVNQQDQWQVAMKIAIIASAGKFLSGNFRVNINTVFLGPLIIQPIFAKINIMSTAHAQEVAPDSMTGGFTRLLIVATLALLAALIFYGAALPLKNSENKHRNEVTGNVPVQLIKA